MIAFFVKGQSIEVPKETVAIAKTYRYLKAQFIFVSNDWKGHTVTAFFARENLNYAYELDENNTVDISGLPAGEWEVSLMGTKKENGTLVQRITTETVLFSIEPFKTDKVDRPPASQPTEFEKIQNSIGDMSKLKTEDKSSLVNAVNEIHEQVGLGGADCFSPTVDVEEIVGGHRVTVTDVDGAESFDVLNGVDGNEGKSAYQSAVDGGYKGTEEEFNSVLANIGISKRPTDTIELTAIQGFIVPGIDVGLTDGSFAICDLYGALDENVLPVGTEIAKIELRRESDDPETGWIDINKMYKRDGSFMHIVYSEVFLLNGYRMIAVAISQGCGESFIIEELNVFNNPVARVTYYTD